MKKLSLQQILASNPPKRTRAYKHKPGVFHLTANFRDAAIDQARIGLIGSLSKLCTQKVLAQLFGTSTATIGKMVRCYFARGDK